jgi:hypothetical protein
MITKILVWSDKSYMFRVANPIQVMKGKYKDWKNDVHKDPTKHQGKTHQGA